LPCPCEGDHDTVVLVESGNNDLHVRLAAWYYKHGAISQPTIQQLLQMTYILPTSGPVNANIYQEIEFTGEKFVDSKKIEYTGDYYSGEYVDWLERQLGIDE